MNKRPIYWIIPDVLSKKEILSINRISKKSGINEPEQNGARVGGKTLKHTTSKLIIYSELKKYLSNVFERCSVINREQYGFDVHPINHYDYILTNTYNVDGRYDWHTDIANNYRFEDLKLTVLINISTKSYEGGDLEIFHHVINRVDNFKPGALIMFPSMYNHRVTPITEGERISLTMFMKGPLLK
jgi:predicted 2-oxoglutarate/Fe(II)-dependent dioxygenase YbiX|tara:strand:+ start:5351 stop:5908 length:558 start_codon:yes stop_codon:yes gene_type:complete